MNQSSSLFKLIQSLNAGERRAITVAIKSHKYAKAYQKIFKELSVQKNYDEQKLKARLKEEPFIDHFAVIKNQLYQVILKTLRNVYESSSLEFVLKEFMMDAAILSQKALHAESWQKLQRVRELALDLEDWKTLLEVLYKEFVHVSTAKSKASTSDEYKRIAKELETYVHYLSNYETFAYYFVTLSALVKDYQITKEEKKLSEIDQLVTAPVLQEENNAVTFRARMIYNNIWSSYFICFHNYNQAQNFLATQIKLFKQNEKFIEWIPGNYVIAYRDLVACNFFLEKYADAQKVINELKSLSTQPTIKKVQGRRFSVLIFSWTFKYEIGIALYKSQKDSFTEYFKTQETFFNQHIAVFDSLSRFETMLSIAGYYFITGNSKKSMRYLENILNNEITSHLLHIFTIASFMQILIHFEEENENIIEYLLKSFKKIIQGNKHASLTEKLMLEFCIKLDEIINNKTKKQVLQSYAEKFKSLKKIDNEKQWYLFFDVTNWLNKQIK